MFTEDKTRNDDKDMENNDEKCTIPFKKLKYKMLYRVVQVCHIYVSNNINFKSLVKCLLTII